MRDLKTVKTCISAETKIEAHRKFPKCLVVPGHFGFEPVWVIGAEEGKIAARPLAALSASTTQPRCLAAGGR